MNYYSNFNIVDSYLNPGLFLGSEYTHPTAQFKYDTIAISILLVTGKRINFIITMMKEFLKQSFT